MEGFLSKDDHEEPKYLLNMHPQVTPIPVGRIIDKPDSYLSRNDYDAAERHLKYNIIEEIASETITQLQDKELTKAICGDLEKHIHSVNDRIADITVRNMNILIAVGD